MTEPQTHISHIEYGLTTNTLNAFYNIHQNTGAMYLMMYLLNGAQQITTVIKANYYFHNILHCWNETGDNVTCTQ